MTNEVLKSEEIKLEHRKKASSMISKDLIPTTQSQRKTGYFGYFNIWVGLAIILATFAVGGEGIAMVNLQQLIVASIIGCLILGVLCTLGGDIGLEHGISYPTYMRVIFGSKGMLFMNVLRTFYGAMWFGIQTYFGAIAINVIIRAFTGFDNWLVWFIVFDIVQVINTAYGFKAIEKFANIAAPSILLIGMFMVFKMIGIADENNIQVWNTISGMEASIGGMKAFIYIMILNMCFWADGATDVETWTRYVKVVPGERNFLKRNKYALVGHALALPIAETFMVFIGGLSLLVVNNYNPVEAIQKMTSNPLVLSVLLLMVILAQWSTNNTANLLPPALCLNSITKNKIKYPVAVAIVGVLGYVIQPWILIENISVFLKVIGSIWSSVLGLSLADYYFIRRRQINIPDLYDEEKGQFKFNGWNWAGVITVVISLTCCYFASSYSIFVGLIVSFTCYSILGKYWFFKKYPQAEMLTKDQYLGITVGREWLYDEEKHIIYPSK